MSNREFSHPLFVQAEGIIVREVATLDDAFDLLRTWPQSRRDVAYRAALTACMRAEANLMSTETLRENIRRFFKMADVLVKVDPHPIDSSLRSKEKLNI